jgi:transcriptional regulator with XRE-family HTH domain
MSDLASTIRRLRTSRGMSLQKLADAAAISKAHLWEMEKGRHDNPSIDTLSSLAGALGVSAIELFRAAMK